jgi:NADH:ubiquinone oxidoreductase subunit C
VVLIITKLNFSIMNLRLNLEHVKILSRIIPISGVQIFNNDIILVINFKHVVPIIRFLKDHLNCQYKVLVAISGVDHLESKVRFEINYEVLSLKFNNRLRIKTYASEITPVSSIGATFRDLIQIEICFCK